MCFHISGARWCLCVGWASARFVWRLRVSLLSPPLWSCWRRWEKKTHCRLPRWRGALQLQGAGGESTCSGFCRWVLKRCFGEVIVAAFFVHYERITYCAAAHQYDCGSLCESCFSLVFSLLQGVEGSTPKSAATARSDSPLSRCYISTSAACKSSSVHAFLLFIFLLVRHFTQNGGAATTISASIARDAASRGFGALHTAKMRLEACETGGVVMCCISDVE